MDAIILAGGFGTRLQHVVSEVPKPMALVAGKPFLCYLLDNLQNNEIEHVIFSTGYKHECIESYFGNRYQSIRISYSHEAEPLFTGGAMALALQQAAGDDVLVLNGDTLFDIDINRFRNFHRQTNAWLSIALRPIADTVRYGCVKIDANQRIVGFTEKGAGQGCGLINGGIYLINRQLFQSLSLPKKFSFEKEILEKEFAHLLFYGLEFHSYFIDIGVPDDYFRAQRELSPTTWAEVKNARYLFLDRDGVINKRIVGDYVTQSTEFEFLPGVLEAMPVLAQRFEKILIVTNQQGISKGRFSEDDLEKVHSYMRTQIEKAGGRIDAIYYCSDLAAANSPDRKPAAGMAWQALRDFPDMDFTYSLMVGDALSDLQFARNAGMRSAYLTNGETVPVQVTGFTNVVCKNLWEMCQKSAEE